jgi:hypothetical protein
VVDAETRIPAAGTVEGGLEVLLAADQVKFRDLWIGLKRFLNAINDHSGPVVAAHDIHDDSHK